VFLSVTSRENTIRVRGQFESAVNNERGIHVVDYVIFCYAIVFDRVVNEPAEEGDIRPGANLAEEIRGRRGSREARIDGDHFCAPRASPQWPT